MDTAQKPTNATMDLSDQETLHLFEQGLEEYMREENATSALNVFRAFEPQFRASGLTQRMPTLAAQYGKIFLKMQWVAFPLLEEKEMLELCEKHLLVPLTEFPHDPPFSLWEYIERMLRSILILEERTRRKKEIQQALVRNAERMTQSSVVLDDKEERGTLANWFRDYHRTVGTGGIDRIKLAQYFAQGENFAKAPKEEQARLKMIFEIYEKLKAPSTELAGYEDPIGVDDPGEEGVVRYGVFEKIDLAAVRKKLAEKAQYLGEAGARLFGFGQEEKAIPVVPPPVAAPVPVMTMMPEDTARMQKIQEAKHRILASGKEPVALLRDMLVPPQGANRAPREEVGAGVLAVAEKMLLEQAMQDAIMKERFVAYLKTKNQPELVEGFRMAPATPKYLRYFLQWALQDRAGYEEHAAAQIAVQIGNVLRRQGNGKYTTLAYWDEGTKEFRWNS